MATWERPEERHARLIRLQQQTGAPADVMQAAVAAEDSTGGKTTDIKQTQQGWYANICSGAGGVAAGAAGALILSQCIPYLLKAFRGGKTRRNRKSMRKSRRSKRGGAAAPNAARAPAAPGANTRDRAEQAMKAHCEANRIDEQAFFMGVMNNDYHLRENPRLNTKGLQNPCIVGNFVFRARGHRDYYLEARPKTAADTPAALDAMREGAPGVTDNVYIDQANNAKYVVITSMSDR
jgi:hypothetical protein